MAKRTPQRRKDNSGAPGRGSLKPIYAWPVLVGMAAFVVYANALGNGLVYDDHFLIERSWLVERLDFRSVFVTHYWAGYPGNETGHYRPLPVLSFLLDALGGIRPFRYHLTNVLLHVCCSLLAWGLCRRAGLSRFSAGAAGLLFAVHPIHSEWNPPKHLSDLKICQPQSIRVSVLIITRALNLLMVSVLSFHEADAQSGMSWLR